MRLSIPTVQPTPIPTKTVPDWAAVADYVSRHGAWFAPHDINVNAAHAALHRKGIGVRAVRGENNVTIAYCIAPLHRRGAA